MESVPAQQVRPVQQVRIRLGDLAPVVEEMRKMTGLREPGDAIRMALALFASGHTIDDLERRATPEYAALSAQCENAELAVDRARARSNLASASLNDARARGATSALIARLENEERTASRAYHEALRTLSDALRDCRAYLYPTSGA